MAEEILMSSLPDCASPPLAPTPPPIPIVTETAPAVAASRPPRTWYFIGTTLFGLFIFGVQNLAEVATLVVLFIRSGLDQPPTPDQMRALAHNGGWLGLYVIVACPFVLGALWVPIRIARQSFYDYLALRWPNRGELARGLALLAAFLALSFILRTMFGQTIPAFMVDTYSSARADGTLWLYVIGLCVAAPIIEEFWVRGFIFRGWSQSFLGTTGTIVLSSAVLAGLHTQYNAFYMTQIFLLGLLFATLRHRSGSTWLTVLLHGTYNAAAVVHVVLAVP
jgi:membrane protease YdiL (CAAX protease family)